MSQFFTRLRIPVWTQVGPLASSQPSLHKNLLLLLMYVNSYFHSMSAQGQMRVLRSPTLRTFVCGRNGERTASMSSRLEVSSSFCHGSLRLTALTTQHHAAQITTSPQLHPARPQRKEGSRDRKPHIIAAQKKIKIDETPGPHISSVASQHLLKSATTEHGPEGSSV